jgi:hypothetical protein
MNTFETIMALSPNPEPGAKYAGKTSAGVEA